MTDLARLVLQKDAERRLRKGHLWIYSNEVDTAQTPLKQFTAGEQVNVECARGKFLGIAMVNPNGLICARLVSRNADYPLNKSLLVHRINQALSLREACFAQPYYRLVYGDSDLLPGLVVDRFNDVLVVQISTAGMEREKDAVVEALQQCLAPRGILLRNDHSGRSLEQLPEQKESVGDVPEFAEVVENGVRFQVPISAGQKTGWFYDHRSNRQMLQSLCNNKRVLDVFSYIGGWGIQAAVAGASEVVLVDSSAQALEWAGANAELNGVTDRLSGMQGKATDAMKALLAEKQRFDIVVLDPPAFIKRRKDHKAGLAAYHHVIELGMRLLGRDGMLVAGSCSMHLARAELSEVLRAAGRKLDRHVQIIHQGGQGADHPAHPTIPETDYLKAHFARVLYI